MCLWVFVRECMHVCVLVFICVIVCMCVCVFAFVCVFVASLFLIISGELDMCEPNVGSNSVIKLFMLQMLKRAFTMW